MLILETCMQFQNKSKKGEITLNTRNEAIEKVSKQRSIYKKKEKYYVLKHTYDVTPTPVILKTTIDFKTMDLLVAYLQFKADELKHAYSFDQTDMANIMTKYFNIEILDSFTGRYYEIDLYECWEHWAGEAAKVETIPQFHNDEMLKELEALVKKVS